MPNEMIQPMSEDTRATIYTMTCFAYLELDERGRLRTGGSRTFGYYTNRDWAIEDMHCNNCDMWERTYDYAVIEAMREGVHSECDEEIWFKYDQERNGFFEIPKPEAVVKSHQCNWAFG